MGKNMFKKGFSLLELILVLGVGTMVAFMKFQDMRNEQESALASAVGQQLKQKWYRSGTSNLYGYGLRNYLSNIGK